MNFGIFNAVAPVSIEQEIFSRLVQQAAREGEGAGEEFKRLWPTHPFGASAMIEHQKGALNGIFQTLLSLKIRLTLDQFDEVIRAFHDGFRAASGEWLKEAEKQITARMAAEQRRIEQEV